MFFTTFQNKKGQEIYDSRQIAKHYVKTSRFVFDCLSILGIDIITHINNKMKIFGFFKLARIKRLSTFLNQLNQPEDLKALFQFFKLMLYLGLLLNA